MCNKAAYMLDSIKVEDIVFHKACFRCAECKGVLSLGKFAALGGQYYCKPHFKQLFKLKGNYDEGFGRQQHKTQWGKEDGDHADAKPEVIVTAAIKSFVPTSTAPAKKEEVVVKKEEPKKEEPVAKPVGIAGKVWPPPQHEIKHEHTDIKAEIEEQKVVDAVVHTEPKAEKPAEKVAEKPEKAEKPAVTAAKPAVTAAKPTVAAVKPEVASKPVAAAVAAAETKAPVAARKYGAAASPSCEVCNKAVYPMDELRADGKVFHKTCLRCHECNRTLSLGSYAAIRGTYFCKPHFKQLFALKGNYDEGFGHEQHKTKWGSNKAEESAN